MKNDLRQFGWRAVESEQGIALLTTMMLMLIVTTLGIGAIAVSSFENRVAGMQRSGETVATVAESCMSTSVNIIQQTILQAQLPTTFHDGTPGAPVPNASATASSPNFSLFQEIMGQSDNDPDDPSLATTLPNGPDYAQTVGGFTVTGDIDRMYVAPKSGTGLQFASGYEGIGRASCRERV